MGEVEGWEEPGWSLPNGLLPGSGPVMQAVDTYRWLKVEERTAELISCIQPTQLSEQRRNAVADYVQRLIKKCFPCEVKTFGSVPLKTYLPDGDIDLTLTASNNDQNLKDTWANQVRDMLENEEKNVNAEFHVKEVQYIQAEVKIIKCLVENIVVDISFNQVGGLCTLCFLIEIDNRIKQNHLFKRSIILIKAWCYYESRILGAHHGLISTYALETLVLYIFHVFSNSFHGPLEVLYRFLEFFSKFDWDNFCISLWGPVPISALPDVTAEPPRKDSRELLLSKMFLDACRSVYAAFPVVQENNGQPFVSKHFNVIDPLRVNNNLGRSVSKGNFFRIRSAFAFGAKKLARLLNCPEENLTFEVNQFFMNTLERHGTGHRHDAPGLDSRSLRSLTPDSPQKFENSKNSMSEENVNESSSVRGMDNEGIRSCGVSSRAHSLKKQHNSTSLRVTDKIRRDPVSDQVVLDDEVQRYLKSDHLVTDSQGRFIFPRTRSSPELTDMCGDVSSHAWRTKKESTNAHARLVKSNRRRNLGSESLAKDSTCSSVEETSLVRNHLSQQSLDAAVDSKSGTNNFHREFGLEKETSSSTTHIMHQEQEDIANMVTSASLEGFTGQFHLPFHLTSGHQPFPIPPSFIASMGYTQQNFPGFVPTNVPFMDLSFPNMNFSHGLVPPKLIHNFPDFGLNTPSDDSIELTENFGHAEMNSRELDGDIWQEQDVDLSVGYDHDNENSDTHQLNDKQPASSSSLKYVPPFRARVKQKHSQEKHESVPENVNSFPIQDSRTGEVYAEERPSSSRFSLATRNSSMRSRTSSESSRDGSVKTPKSTKERREKQSKDVAPAHGKVKIVSEHEHVSNQVEGDDPDWSLLLDAGPEMIERNRGPGSVSSLQFPRHHSSGSDVAQTSGSDSIPFGPMLICSGPGHITGDKSGMVPFYLTGPPVPFLTMLYKTQPETGTSDASSGHFSETLDTTESEQNFSPRGFDQSDHLSSLNSLRGSPAIETSEEQQSDNILESGVDGHKNNLRFGRLSQNPQPLLYLAPVMDPPAFLQGRFQYDNTVRPHWTSSNILSQLMASNGHRVVPDASLPSVSGRPPNVYQRYVDDIPRYRNGTGTYLPNPSKVSPRGHSSGTRRGNYNHDRNGNYGDREGNWNGNSKSHGAARGHTRNQIDKSNSRTDRLASNESRADRSKNSYKNELIPPHQLQNDPVHSSSSLNGPQNLVASNPNDNHDEQLEVGSLGPGGFQSINEGTGARTFEDHRLRGNPGQRFSPDELSSPPHHQREYFPRKRR